MTELTQEEQIKRIQYLLVQAQVQRKTKLTNGSILRQQMINDIEAGKSPTGYRVDWLNDSSVAVVNYLGEIAAKFNEAHPDDAASANDLLDILNMALYRFNSKLGQKQGDKDD